MSTTQPGRTSEAPLPRRGASALRAARAVAWSFFGIRRSSGLEQDVQQLKPAQVLIAGLIGALIFVVALVLLVRWVVTSGVAA
jgi:hypothetical protein